MPRPPRKTLADWGPTDVELAEAQAIWEARENFWAFRRYMRPGMLWGWWVETVSVELQRFYEAFVAGKRPKLARMAPPQHGKSIAAEDFIAWVAGKNPDLKTIFASFSETLGSLRNLNLQRTMQSPRYRMVFPDSRIGSPGWQCNSDLIEYVGHAGSFRNTTVGGSINGLELHLGVLDDPVKGRAEATSKTIRDGTWLWFADDWGSRFAANSAMLIIMTRWHVDDLLGRYLEKERDIRIVRFPAIAEYDELHRRAGEALFPALKPLDFLLERRKIMSKASWASEYQQHPIVEGGGIFPIDKLSIAPVFDRSQIAKSMRAWDKAGTAGGDGAFTAGVLMIRCATAPS
jgi:hypothetical protein